jgi:hypothetical protein
MRRFVCVAALLFGFSGNGYLWTVRVRESVAIEMPARMREEGGTVRGPAWWRTA